MTQSYHSPNLFIPEKQKGLVSQTAIALYKIICPSIPSSFSYTLSNQLSLPLARLRGLRVTEQVLKTISLLTQFV